MVYAISDRAYGCIDPDTFASVARAIEQETVKRQLRARTDVETHPEERVQSPAEAAETALIVADHWHLLEPAKDDLAACVPL